MKDFTYEDIAVSSTSVRLSRKQTLELIRALASQGDEETTFSMRVFDTSEGKQADFSIGYGMGMIVPVRDTHVRLFEDSDRS